MREGNVDPSAARVVVTSVFADENKGGAALTVAAIRHLRDAFPSGRVTLVSVWHVAEHLPYLYRHTLKYDSSVEVLPAPVGIVSGRFAGLRMVLQTLPYFIVRPGPSSPPAIRRIMEADLVACKAGYHTFRDKAGLRGVLSLWMTAFPFLLAIRYGIPTAVMPSAMGPFTQPLSNRVNGWILRRTSLILARDTRSVKETERLGVSPSRIVEVPDGAFGISPPEPEAVARMVRRYGLEGTKYAAMTVRGLGTRDSVSAYVDRLAGVVRRLLDRGSVDRVAVVVQDELDLEPSKALVERLADSRIVHIVDDLAPTDLIALYGGGRVTIGSRLHSAIFSLIGGTPAFGVSMEGTKTEGIFEGLGLGRMVVPSQMFDPDDLAGKVEQTVAAGEGARQQVRDAVAKMRAGVSKTTELLRRLVTERVSMGVRGA
jgi:polysaccharide pyruvyl transferase WcaK-like protein